MNRAKLLKLHTEDVKLVEDGAKTRTQYAKARILATLDKLDPAKYDMRLNPFVLKVYFKDMKFTSLDANSTQLKLAGESIKEACAEIEKEWKAESVGETGRPNPPYIKVFLKHDICNMTSLNETEDGTITVYYTSITFELPSDQQ